MDLPTFRGVRGGRVLLSLCSAGEEDHSQVPEQQLGVEGKILPLIHPWVGQGLPRGHLLSIVWAGELRGKGLALHLHFNFCICSLAFCVLTTLCLLMKLVYRSPDHPDRVPELDTRAVPNAYRHKQTLEQGGLLGDQLPA